jgi:hypothetical protein
MRQVLSQIWKKGRKERKELSTRIPKELKSDGVAMEMEMQGIQRVMGLETKDATRFIPLINHGTMPPK